MKGPSTRMLDTEIDGKQQGTRPSQEPGFQLKLQGIDAFLNLFMKESPQEPFR